MAELIKNKGMYKKKKYSVYNPKINYTELMNTPNLLEKHYIPNPFSVSTEIKIIVKDELTPSNKSKTGKTFEKYMRKWKANIIENQK